MSSPLKKSIELLQSVKGKTLTRDKRIPLTIQLATYLLEATREETTAEEEDQEERVAGMMEDPMGKAFVTALTDQAFRSSDPARTVNQIKYLLSRFGIPQFLGEADRFKMLLFKWLGSSFPHLFLPQIKKQVRKELAHVLLPEDPKKREAYFEKNRLEGTRINLNHLGEAILGEEEAQRRLQTYLHDLSETSIDYISIKISTLYSQINLLGWKHTLNILAERLSLLYRAAMLHPTQLYNGKYVPKFINLDMEESRDLDLTVELFKQVLNEEEFLPLSAGLVLQSYLPHTFNTQHELTRWALDRRSKGGAPIKLRIVKGANLAMESVEASLRGWPQAPFTHKEEADANFKRMIEYALHPARVDAVHIGIGSHNLLDIAYALLLRAETNTEQQVGFEMLEGMAEPMRRVVQKVSGSMLIYCPEAKEEDFHAAVAYLIRRLDENTGPQNFLRHLFELQPGTEIWKREIDFFKLGCSKIEDLSSLHRRTQDRLAKNGHLEWSDAFTNEPDTDFSLASNRTWAHQIYRKWENKKHPPIPLVIAGEEHRVALKEGKDPSRPDKTLYVYSIADFSLLEKALECAKAQESTWAAVPLKERSKMLGKVAGLFRQRRDELIGSMIADAGKIVQEGDTEVSEAIDFLEYYRRNWEKIITSYSDVAWLPRGTFLVAPPWNFPCSIPTGGIAAALMAGNCVIFKPAPETVLVGWTLVQLFWEAGIPREVLQWVNCEDEPTGSQLVQDRRLNGVILTGATSTAKTLLKLRPSLYLAAETGGKNAMVITSLSDRDLAIKDLLQSAFGHAGQKCSACSLAILEASVYDDPHFLNQLKDAAESLAVGSAWDPNTKIPPLIRPAEGYLKKGLLELDEGESWLLQPQAHSSNSQLWTPGIKLGVKPGSFTHRNELFGPVLGVMRAQNLSEAIEFANGTPYGLTSGLHSLDDREHAIWKEKIEAGNLYINRTTTGAIVRRQPFGGCKASSVGPGAKAGGPNYVLQFAKPKQLGLPHERTHLPSSVLPLFTQLQAYQLNEEQMNQLQRSAESYAHWAQVLKEASDPSCVLGQDNQFYCIPRKKVALRLGNLTSIVEFLQVCLACLICDTPLEISSSKEEKHPIGSFRFFKESEEEFLNRLKNENMSSFRCLEKPSESLSKQSSHLGIFIDDAPVLAHGRFELLHYLREVSLSVDYHRYGNLGIRDPSIKWKKT